MPYHDLMDTMIKTYLGSDTTGPNRNTYHYDLTRLNDIAVQETPSMKRAKKHMAYREYMCPFSKSNPSLWDTCMIYCWTF